MQFAKVVSAAVLSGCLLVGVWGTPVMAQSGGDGGGGDILVFDILGVTDNADAQSPAFDGRLLTARDLTTER